MQQFLVALTHGGRENMDKITALDTFHQQMGTECLGSTSNGPRTGWIETPKNRRYSTDLFGKVRRDIQNKHVNEVFRKKRRKLKRYTIFAPFA